MYLKLNPENDPPRADNKILLFAHFFKSEQTSYLFWIDSFINKTKIVLPDTVTNHLITDDYKGKVKQKKVSQKSIILRTTEGHGAGGGVRLPPVPLAWFQFGGF